MSGNKAAYVTEYMATLAGEGVELTPRLAEIFSGVLQRQLEKDEAGKITQKSNFETLAKVFTFVSSPVGDRPATPLAYAREDLDAAKAAAEDEKVIGLTIDDVSVTEGDAGTTAATFTVTLSEAPGAGEEVTVDYETADDTATAGSDYVAAAGVLTFTEGETSKTVEVTVNGDLLEEGVETFNVVLSNVAGTINGEDVVISDATGVGTIIDIVVDSAVAIGSNVYVMFSESLDSSALPGVDAFTVSLDGQNNPAVSSLKCNGDNLLILRLDHTLSQNDTLTLSYTDPTTADDANALQDTSGNDVATFTDLSIHNDTPAPGDNIAPTIDSVNATGNTVILTLSEEFNVFESGSMSDFLVTDSDNNQLTITGILRNSGDSGSTIELTLDSALTSGETITVEYTDPNPGEDDTDAVQDLTGNDLASVTKTFTVGGITDLLSAAQSKSVTISGIDNDTLVPQDNYIVAALYEGGSWLEFQEVSDLITYSFNEDQPPEYDDSGDADGWQPVASHVRDAINEIMSIIDGMILPDIEKVSNGQIRFNMVETDGDTAAYGYLPGSDDISGDIFLGLDIGTDPYSGNVDPYGAGRSTIVHEIGHALGLIHPFVEDGVDRLNPPLPAAEDNSANTVMSYTDFRMELQNDGTLVTPDHFMPYDIAALQAVYGPDTNYRASDNTYSFVDTPFYTTIWDAGGVDILDFSSTGSYNVIDLTPGSHSNINYRDISGSDFYTGENALGIAWGTIVEKVTGGPAGNKITDNAVDNYLTGGVGDDLFYLGAGGFDTVVGGGGYDLVMLEQYNMGDVELGSYGDSVLLAGDDFAVQMLGIAGVQFADQLYSVV